MTATLVILGASGDLTSRLLLPGLGTLLARDTNRDLRIVGADYREMPLDQWKQLVTTSLTQAGCQPGSTALAAAEDTRWITVDVTNLDSMKHLLSQVQDASPLVLYFALAPGIAQKAIDSLQQLGIPQGTQLAFEKPFGGGLEGARELNAKLATLVPEESVHRVDHFLGLATVLDLISLRFANRLFQPVWDADNIESIRVVFDESLTLEGRAGYYDKAGAMVDMIQSHLLQVVALTAMEAPARISAVELRDMTTQVLRAVQPWGGDPVTSSHRARYTAGTIGDRQVPDYTAEPGVDPSRNTETLAQITVEICNGRWAGVPVTIRSGKSIGTPQKAIEVTFRDVRHLPEGLKGHDSQDSLIIRLEPDQLELHLTTNAADDALGLTQSVLTADLMQASLKPYGEVLAGILDGDATLTVRGDAAEECWRVIDAYQKAWASGAVPMETYAAGSDGPAGW